MDLPVDLDREGAEYALGRIVADAQRWATHAQIAMMNNGGIRTALAAGAVTWGELYQLQPFANTLVRMQVRGADVRAYLARELGSQGEGVHVSGIEVWLDDGEASGSRIAAIELENGEPLRDDQTYTVTMNNFMAFRGGDASIAARALDVEETPIVDLDALVGYLEQVRTLSIPSERRIHVQAEATP